MECPICYDLMINPWIVNCGHTFCTKCIEQMGDTCSVCRSNIYLRIVNYALKEVIQSEHGESDSAMCKEHKIPNMYQCVQCNNVSLCIYCVLHSPQHWNHRCVPVK
ncbi:RING E3 ubiquitin ligase [European chub iridovirus]|nr:RING E3 ubiquitin ligase [European chub iridovirus]